MDREAASHAAQVDQGEPAGPCPRLCRNVHSRAVCSHSGLAERPAVGHGIAAPEAIRERLTLGSSGFLASTATLYSLN